MRYFLLIIFMALIGKTGIAQTKRVTEWGVSYGYSRATIYAPDEPMEGRGGLNVAVSYDHYFSKNWSFKTKLQYDMKGTDSSDASARYKKELSERTQYRLNYLSVPLLASWHFGYQKIHYLDFGPYAAVLLNDKMTFNHVTTDAGARGFDMGLYFAIGARYAVKSNFKVFAEIRGLSSFTDFKKGADGNGYRNSIVAFASGFNF